MPHTVPASFQKLLNMSKTLIIFDIDGTLLYSNKIDSVCFSQVYTEIYKREFPTIDWSYFPAVSDTVIFETVIKEQFGRIPAVEEINFFRSSFVQLLKQKRVENPEDFREVPGAKKLVESLLQDSSYIVGIGTGGWRLPAEVKLRHIGLDSSKLIVSAADGKYSREAIIQEVLDSPRVMGQEIQDVVYIGDAEWDVKTTRNMRMKFVGVRRQGDHAYLKDRGAQSVITDFSDQQLFHEYLKAAQVPSFGGSQ